MEKPQTFRFKNIHLYYWTELPPEILTPSRPQQNLLLPDLNPTIISTVVIGSWHLLASTKQILRPMVYTKKTSPTWHWAVTGGERYYASPDLPNYVTKQDSKTFQQTWGKNLKTFDFLLIFNPFLILISYMYFWIPGSILV